MKRLQDRFAAQIAQAAQEDENVTTYPFKVAEEILAQALLSGE